MKLNFETILNVTIAVILASVLNELAIKPLLSKVKQSLEISE